MRPGRKLVAVSMLLLAGLLSIMTAQDANRLSQKLLLETTIAQRVTNAISRILDPSQFVVDVQVEMSSADGMTAQRAFQTPSGRMTRQQPQTKGKGKDTVTGNKATPGATVDNSRSSVSNPYPIPGFPTMGRTVARPAAGDESTAAGDELEDFDLDESFEDVGPAPNYDSQSASTMPVIRAMALNIILEDGVTPQIIENVRQVTLVASRFDRDRGDVLSITTAAFKNGVKPSYAQTGLKTENDAETELLRETIKEVEGRNQALMNELRNKELEYLNRSEEERKKALSDLATVQNERSKDLIFLQQQREDQNARLQDALLGEIAALREEITGGGLSEQEQDIKSIQATSLEDSVQNLRASFAAEKARLEAQIQSAVQRSRPGDSGMGGISGTTLALIFGFLLLVGLVVTVLMMNNRNRQQLMGMPMGYPGQIPPQYRRRPKKRRSNGNDKAKRAQAKPEAAVAGEAAQAVAAQPAASAQTGVADDPDVLRSELQSIRQSVVSMSVGRQETASRILGDWIEQEDAGGAGQGQGGALDNDLGTIGEEDV
ncbi:hypothetical protein ACFL6E_01435 [Candidatus Neomarinimicrobiota bacterium]